MATRLEKCLKCDNNAVWWYMPSDRVYCDSCVPRGCECNYKNDTPDPLIDGVENKDWMWIEKDTFNPLNSLWTYIDEQGREYPCCEYSYDEEGYEIDDEPEIDKNVSDFE